MHLLDLNTGRPGDPSFLFRGPAEGPLANGDDDGVIDPRDTRTVLGLCLSAVHSAVVEGAGSSVVPPRQDQPTDVSVAVKRLEVPAPRSRLEGFRRFVEVLRTADQEGARP